MFLVRLGNAPKIVPRNQEGSNRHYMVCAVKAPKSERTFKSHLRIKLTDRCGCCSGQRAISMERGVICMAGSPGKFRLSNFDSRTWHLIMLRSDIISCCMALCPPGPWPVHCLNAREGSRIGERERLDRQEAPAAVATLLDQASLGVDAG